MALPGAIVAAAALLGGLAGDAGTGALWGLIFGVGLTGALALLDVRAGPVMIPASIIAAVGTTLLLQGAGRLTPLIVVGVGAAWLVPGAASAWLSRRAGGARAAGVAGAWPLAGMIAVAIAESTGGLGLDTGEGLSLLTVALVAGMAGGLALLAAISGVTIVGIGAIVGAITVLAGSQVGFSIGGLIENVAGMARAPDMWPPDFAWAIGDGTWWWLPSWDFGAPARPSPLIETFRIAIIASVAGCLTALPVAFMASAITAPGKASYLLNKAFMNVIRTIPDLFWAMVFVAAVGVGPLAGVLALFFFSLAIMAKLLSETIDSVDTGPLEAAKATGGSHFPAVRVSVLPQVLPNYVAYALYIFELNIRASVVLGLVGAGGIGRVLEAQRSFFRFDRVLAVVILIFVLVLLIEQVSVALRRRLV